MLTGKIEIPLGVDTEAFDEWCRSVRLLVSQIGFAIDNYLATRPSATEDARPCLMQATDDCSRIFPCARCPESADSAVSKALEGE